MFLPDAIGPVMVTSAGMHASVAQPAAFAKHKVAQGSHGPSFNDTRLAQAIARTSLPGQPGLWRRLLTCGDACLDDGSHVRGRTRCVCALDAGCLLLHNSSKGTLVEDPLRGLLRAEGRGVEPPSNVSEAIAH